MASYTDSERMVAKAAIANEAAREGGMVMRGKRHYGDDRDTTSEHPETPATNDPQDYATESYRAPIRLTPSHAAEDKTGYQP